MIESHVIAKTDFGDTINAEIDFLIQEERQMGQNHGNRNTINNDRCDQLEKEGVMSSNLISGSSLRSRLSAEAPPQRSAG